MLGELIINAGGFPVAWYPLREDGTSKADDHPLGEGLEEERIIKRDGQNIVFQPFRRIVLPRADADKFWAFDEDGRKCPVKRLKWDGIKLKEKGHKDKREKKCKNLLRASILDVTDITEATNYDALKNWVKALDTRKNTLYTIGAAGDYAGYNAAIGGGTVSSGDGLRELDGGNYNENVTDNSLNSIQLIGDPSNRPRIWAVAGTLLAIVANNGWVVNYHDFDGTGAAANGIQFNTSSKGNIVNGCIAYGCTYGIQVRGGQNNLLYNSTCYDNSVHGIWLRDSGLGCVIHCTTVDNTNTGIKDASGLTVIKANISAGSGTADFDIPTGDGEAWNVSEDGTAPGDGSQTGFLTSYFEDYAGDDFRINATGQAWLAARFNGWPVTDTDYLGNLRKKSTSSPVFYPGAHDPDPLFSPDNYSLPAEAEVELNVQYGLVTGTENTGSLSVSAPTTPDIAVVRASDTTATVTFSGSDVGVTNRVRYATVADAGDTWLDGGSRTSDGDVTLSGLSVGQSYFIQGFSDSAGAYSEWSEVVIYTAGTATGASGAYALFLEDLYNEIRNSAALTAKVTDGDPSAHVKWGWQLYNDGDTEESLVSAGPILYLQPMPHDHGPRTTDHNRCSFSAAVHIQEKFDQSSNETMITAINFIDSLVKEIMQEADGGVSNWLTKGTHVEVSVEETQKVEGKRDRLGTNLVVSCVWAEDYT